MSIFGNSSIKRSVPDPGTSVEKPLRPSSKSHHLLAREAAQCPAADASKAQHHSSVELFVGRGWHGFHCATVNEALLVAAHYVQAFPTASRTQRARSGAQTSA